MENKRRNEAAEMKAKHRAGVVDPLRLAETLRRLEQLAHDKGLDLDKPEPWDDRRAYAQAHRAHGLRLLGRNMHKKNKKTRRRRG